MARVLIAVNAIGFAAAVLRSERLAEIPDRFATIAVTLEPALLVSLLLLYVLQRMLERIPYVAALVIALAIGATAAAAMAPLTSTLVPGARTDGWWNAACAVAIGLVLAGYFDLRDRAFSPALAEARLQALQARIRPHFLFNSLNAVLALMRRDPARAEGALEDLADLFRSVISEARQLVSLGDEIALTRQYLSLEQLRLGERLQVRWNVDAAAEATLVPPMFLQPLVENAVYHGIEPGLEPGTIDIVARRDGERLLIELSNPYHPDYQHRQGNRMALANIEERLKLHFDLEADLQTKIEDGRFRITIRMPYREAP